MMPALIYDKLAVILGADKVFEAESLDNRPIDDDYFAVVSFEEIVWNSGLERGPQNLTIAIHKPWEVDRNFNGINDLLNAIQVVFKPVDNERGSDGILVTQVKPTGRSGSRTDEGWQTVTRTATYRVSYDELAP